MTTDALFAEYEKLQQELQIWFQTLIKNYGKIGAEIIDRNSWIAAILGDQFEKHSRWSDHPADQKGISEIKLILPLVKKIRELESEYRHQYNKSLEEEYTLSNLQKEDYKMGTSFLRNPACVRWGLRIDFPDHAPLLFSRKEFRQISSYFASLFPTLKLSEKKDDSLLPPQTIWKIHDEKMYNFMKKWKHQIVNKDCGYSDQFEILVICYFDASELTSENISETLEMAEKTACGSVVKICEKFLIENMGDYTVEKLKDIATTYKLMLLLEKLQKEADNTDNHLI